MAWRRFVLVAACAALLGAALGVLTRPAGGPRGRPAALEEALRAVDGWQRRGDRSGLARAARIAQDLGGLAPPWRDEADLVRRVAEDDDAALWEFATGGERGAARARALLLLADRARDPALAARAAQRLREDYPASWAAAGARGAPR